MAHGILLPMFLSLTLFSSLLYTQRPPSTPPPGSLPSPSTSSTPSTTPSPNVDPLSNKTLEFQPVLPSIGSFTVLHTGDCRAACLPVRDNGGACSPEVYTESPEKCYGGMARRQTYVRRIRAEIGSENVLLLDSGAFLQGSLFYALFKGDAVAEYMEDIQYNTTSVSSREFFDGPDNFLRFLNNVSFNTSAYNMDFSQAPLMEAHITPYELFVMDGYVVAVVTVVRTNLGSTTDLGPNITTSDRERGLRAAVQELNDLGIKIIILSISDILLPDLEQLVVSVPNIDLVVLREYFFHGDGTDAEVGIPDGPYPLLIESPTGWPVPVVATGNFGMYVGNIRVEFDALGRLNSAVGESILLDETVPMDPIIQASVEKRQLDVDDNFDNVIGSTLRFVDGRREKCRIQECEMGIVTVEAMYEFAVSTGEPLDFALFNSGGIRDDLQEGEITNGDVFNALPFGNTISRFQLLGEAIPLFLENSVAYAGPNDDQEGTTGRFLQMTNLTVVWNYELPAMSIEDGEVTRNGSRVTSIKLNGAAIVPTQFYFVAVNDFIRFGGDEYIWFNDNRYVRETIDQGITCFDAVVEYIGEHSPLDVIATDRILLDTSSLPFDPLAAKRPSDATVIAMEVLASIAIFIAVLYGVLVVVYKDEGAILSATPLFLVYILLGGIIMLCTVYLLSPDPTVGLCVGTVWCLAIGFSFLYGSLLVKNWRVAKILGGSSQKFFRQKISLLKMNLILLISLAGNILLLILFTVIDEPYVKHNQCQYSGAAEILIWVILGWNAALILPAVWISWRTKHVRQNFNESKHIGWATYNVTLVAVILVAVLATSETVETQYIILSIGIILGVTLTLTLLFIPKIIAAYHHLEVDEINTVELRNTKTSGGTMSE